MRKLLALAGLLIATALALPAATMASWICISGCVPHPDPAPPPCYGGYCCVKGC
jgi:hypothetical protein